MSGLAVYMALHVLARVLIAPAAVELDEAEQLLHTQALQWGYYTDPPLYTWLQLQVFHVMGVSVLALSLLKHALLFAFYAAVYVAALTASGSRRCALAALLTLPLVPVLGWMSHKDLTHTILASTLAAWCVVLVLRASPRPRTWHYALLGGLLGLGILSKYAFLLFVAGLACAVGRDPRWARFVRDARCGLTLAVAAAIVAPHAVWLWEHRQVFALIAYKLHRPADVPLAGWSAMTAGLGQMASAVAGFVTPLVLAYSIAGGWRFFSRESWRRWPAVSRMLSGLAVVVLGLTLVGVVAFQVTELKSRWFHTSFFVGAIILPLALATASGRERLRWIIRLGGAAAAVTLLAIPIHHVVGAKVGNPSRASAPFARLGPEIWNAFPGATRVLAADRVIAGSLRLQRPALAFWIPEYWTPRLAPASGDSLAVWDATHAPAPPRGLRRLVEDSTGQDLGRMEARFFDAAYPFQTGQSMRLAVVRLPVKGPTGGGRGQEP